MRKTLGYVLALVVGAVIGFFVARSPRIVAGADAPDSYRFTGPNLGPRGVELVPVQVLSAGNEMVDIGAGPAPGAPIYTVVEVRGGRERTFYAMPRSHVEAHRANR